MHTFMKPLTATLAVTAVGFASADTIVLGDPGYVGSFTGVALDTDATITGLDIGDGWRASLPGNPNPERWTIETILTEDVAVRQNETNKFNDDGIGIAFATPAFDTATLAFEYDASGVNSNFADELPEFVVYAIDDTGGTADGTGIVLSDGPNEGDFDSTDNDDEGPSATITGSRFEYRLVFTDEIDTSVEPASGIYTSTPFSLQKNVNTVGYAFAFRTAAQNSDVTLDNVSLIPEPASLALVAAGLGLTLSRRRH